MPSLIDAIQIIPPHKDDEPEDIFASAPGLIFTDDTRNHHGDPGSLIVYRSPRFGNLEFRTADPQIEDERKLFSHYLWNAGIKLAALIGQDDDTNWNVAGQSVLELGAGTALGGIVATLAGADEVVLSDYPAPVVLANIRRNAMQNIPVELERRYRIEGHEWGKLSSHFAVGSAHRFTRILAADCYWMASQHSNLVRSMLHFLTLDPTGRILAIAGFHTGRANVAAFFNVAVEEGLEAEEIYEEDVEGVRQDWDPGKGEDLYERPKWLVIARLKRRQA